MSLEGEVAVNDKSKVLSLAHSRDNGHIQTNRGGTGYGLSRLAYYKELCFLGFNSSERSHKYSFQLLRSGDRI